MTFIEAYKLYKQGIKVRRSSWVNKEYWLGKHLCQDCYTDLEYEDAIAYDWELFE